MKNIILVLGVMSVNIFFAFMSIIGYKYSGSNESKIYIIYCLIIAMLNIFIFSRDFLKKKFHIFWSDLVILSVPIFMIINYLLTNLINSYIPPYATKSIIYFLLWPTVSIFVAIYISRNNSLTSLIKFFEVIMWLFSIGIIFSTIIPFLRVSSFKTLGGATYQTASYLSAFAYGINLYFIFFGDNYERFKLAKFKIYKLLSQLLIIVQLLGIFISGGRGGIVLFSIYTLYISLIVLKSKNKKYLLKLVLFLTLIGIGIILFLPLLLENEVFLKGFKRVFEFISPTGGVNWKKTSYRDLIYLEAINLINKKLLLGYGLFGLEGYPHNIILEILLQKGIIGLIFAFSIFIIFIRKLNLLIKEDVRNRILIILFFYPITLLMFSGSYMNISEFWFVIALVFSYKLEKSNKEK